MLILLPIAFGLLGALLADNVQEEPEKYGAIKVALPAGSKTRFNPLRKKKRHKRLRAAQALADAAQIQASQPEEPEEAKEVEEAEEEQIDPLEAALYQIDLEVEMDTISTEVAEDMFGLDNDFAGRHHGSKIGWPHTYHKAKK